MHIYAEGAPEGQRPELLTGALKGRGEGALAVDSLLVIRRKGKPTVLHLPAKADDSTSEAPSLVRGLIKELSMAESCIEERNHLVHFEYG